MAGNRETDTPGESEVTAVLQGKRVAGSKKDVKEVQNYHEALDYVERLIEDFRPIKVSDMCDLQKLVTQGLIEERQCERIRTIPVSIVNVWMPDIPRRTVERDVSTLVKKRALKATGESKARIYRLAKGQK